MHAFVLEHARARPGFLEQVWFPYAFWGYYTILMQGRIKVEFVHTLQPCMDTTQLIVTYMQFVRFVRAQTVMCRLRSHIPDSHTACIHYVY